MTTKDHVFRVGTIVSDRDLPPLSKLKDKLEDKGFEGDDVGERRGIRDLEIDRNRGFIFLVYIEEYENKYIGLAEDDPGEETTRKSYPRRIMKVVITESHKIIFESIRGVSAQNAVDFIFSFIEEEVRINVKEKFEREVMLNFYENSLTSLTKYKVKEISEHEPNPIDVTNRVRKILNKFGEVVKYSENSTGGYEDSKKDELTQGFIGTGYPYLLRGNDEDDRVRQIRSSGRISIRYDDDPEEGVSGDDEARLVMRFIEESLPELLEDE